MVPPPRAGFGRHWSDLMASRFGGPGCLTELLVADCSPLTLRSYAFELLDW